MDKTVKLELTIEQLNVVMGGLVKLPIETAMGTFNAVQMQADAQLRSPPPEGPLSDKVIN
jgi:hypothetical protein